MTKTLAFDVYGTLIDTHGVVVRLREFIGDRAGAFSQAWRDKQLEYSFRRGLMRRYASFAVCTRQALDYTSDQFGVALDTDQKAALMAAYRELPAFEDVAESLAGLKAEGHALYAFSNGTAEAVEALIAAASIRALFDGVISVDDVKTFKPNPDVYTYLLDRTAASADDTWLISSNPFDVIGAVCSGLRSAWVRRSTQSVFDPWGIEPTVTITSLHELGRSIGRD